MPLSPELPPWVLPALVALLGLLLGSWLARFRVRLRVAKSRRVGRHGEQVARRLLRKAGFRVVAEQRTLRGTVLVDGDPVEYTVRVDAIVERDGECFVAEFKAGAQTASVSARATRRQLLEYAWLGGCDAVVLVDVVERQVRRVHFPQPRSRGIELGDYA